MVNNIKKQEKSFREVPVSKQNGKHVAHFDNYKYSKNEEHLNIDLYQREDESYYLAFSGGPQTPIEPFTREFRDDAMSDNLYNRCAEIFAKVFDKKVEE